jgi:hypothetical protein
MITHKHHIIPKHIGGKNDPSNLIELTIPEHAEAHRKLYEEHGRWQDRIAWKTLSGSINFAEATRQAQSMDNIGKKTVRRLEATIENAIKGTEAWTGSHHTKESKKRMSKSNKEYWSKMKDRPWQKKTYIIEGKEYLGLESVMDTFGCTMPTVYNRIKNPKFDWKAGSFKNE